MPPDNHYVGAVCQGSQPGQLRVGALVQGQESSWRLSQLPKANAVIHHAYKRRPQYRWRKVLFMELSVAGHVEVLGGYPLPPHPPESREAPSTGNNNLYDLWNVLPGKWCQN